MRLEGDQRSDGGSEAHSGGEIFMAWLPYLLLVVFVLAWGEPSIKLAIDTWTNGVMPSFLPKAPTGLNVLIVPGLHNAIYPRAACRAAAGALRRPLHAQLAQRLRHGMLPGHTRPALILGVPPRQIVGLYTATFRQLKFAMLTIASMLGLAYLMNYSGMTSTLGLALATTGVAFPVLQRGRWMAGRLPDRQRYLGQRAVRQPAGGDGERPRLNPMLTASVNSAAGVMGKMISVQSIAVAVAATGMTAADEGRLFRFTIKHSVLLMMVMGVISMLFAYVFPAGAGGSGEVASLRGRRVGIGAGCRSTTRSGHPLS